jgi:hypothetical protein
MADGTQKNGVAGWIESHLWAILAAGFAAYGGYVTGMTTLTTRVAALEAEVLDLKRKQHGRSEFMVCAVRNLDKVFDKLGVQPACPMEVPE